MTKNIRLNFTAKIKPLKPINDEFTLCKCYILALGKNRNNSVISKEAVTDALSSLYNIPVVGHVFEDRSGKYRLGGHDMKLEEGAGGKYKFKVLTVPFGTVPEDNEIGFEEIVETDGKKKKYLTCNIILWTARYPELKETIYNEQIWFGQSMEIKVLDMSKEKESEYMCINKFSFSALCLLGKSDEDNFNYEPCFPNSKVTPYNFSDAKRDEKFVNAFEEMKSELASCFKQKSQTKVENEPKNGVECTDTNKSGGGTQDHAVLFTPLFDRITKNMQGLLEKQREELVTFMTENFALKPKKQEARQELKVPIGNDTKTKNSKYGEFFETYLNKEVNKY